MNEENRPAAVGYRNPANSVRARRLGIDTQYEAIVFMHKDCPVCRSEGFTAHTRVLLCAGERQVIATLYQVTSDLISHEEAALSESAWSRLDLQDGARIIVTHPAPLDSLSAIRSRIYGHDLKEASLRAIVRDVVEGKYSDIHLASFITACSARPLDRAEVLALTKAMVVVDD
jgi:thymidine phosphorylase